MLNPLPYVGRSLMVLGFDTAKVTKDAPLFQALSASYNASRHSVADLDGRGLPHELFQHLAQGRRPHDVPRAPAARSLGVLLPADAPPAGYAGDLPRRL